MPNLERFAHDAPIDRILDVIERDGAVILTGLMSGANVDALID